MSRSGMSIRRLFSVCSGGGVLLYIGICGNGVLDGIRRKLERCYIRWDIQLVEPGDLSDRRDGCLNKALY